MPVRWGTSAGSPRSTRWCTELETRLRPQLANATEGMVQRIAASEEPDFPAIRLQALRDITSDLALVSGLPSARVIAPRATDLAATAVRIPNFRNSAKVAEYGERRVELR